MLRSPDFNTSIVVRCHKPKSAYDDPWPYLHVTFHDGHTADVEIQSGNDEDFRRPHELLWAPDSHAFLLNGGENAYAGFFVDVYRIDGDKVNRIDITKAAQRDMVEAFPPCKAANRDRTDCKRIEADPEFNMSGIAWDRGSSEVVVMAEVPCSSSYGGIMCQVRGYRLDARNGAILGRMNPNELKQKWQQHMAWDMRIPDPPIYGNASSR